MPLICCEEKQAFVVHDNVQPAAAAAAAAGKGRGEEEISWSSLDSLV